jgi:hypothetical protein
MTIAAGILCSDGLVLCSDTEYTGTTKQTGPKVWITTSPVTDDGCCVAMAGAGETLLLRAIRDRLSAAVLTGMTRGEALQHIQTDLHEFYEDHVYNYPDYVNKRTIQLLIGIRDVNGFSLLQNSDHSLGPIDTSACIGQGTDLGEYLIDSTVRGVVRPPVNTTTGKMLAIYVLMQVKKYSLFCGGNSQVLVIPKQGQPSFMTDAELSAFEKVFSENEGGIPPGITLSAKIAETLRPPEISAQGGEVSGR